MNPIKQEMDIDIREDHIDLDRKHSVDNPKESKEGKPRPIIIKFARYDVSITLYKNEKKLKGKNFLITQNLTAARLALLKEAQEKCGVRNVWTTNGCILRK